MWAGDAGGEISLILAEACLCSWFWTALSHGKRHHELPVAKEILASIPKGIPSHLTRVQCLWHPAACSDLFIYLFYSPLFCLEKTYLFLLPRLRSFFQLLPNPRAMSFERLFGGGTLPCQAGQQPAPGRWPGPAKRGMQCHSWRERRQVGDVVFGTCKGCGVQVSPWDMALALGWASSRETPPLTQGWWERQIGWRGGRAMLGGTEKLCQAVDMALSTWHV